MPYIKEDDRMKFDDIGEFTSIKTPGELNYVISMICQQYIKDNGFNYQKINDIVGALEGAKIEFYRRIAAPYEDKKIKENGDVYEIKI